MEGIIPAVGSVDITSLHHMLGETSVLILFICNSVKDRFYSQMKISEV